MRSQRTHTYLHSSRIRSSLAHTHQAVISNKAANTYLTPHTFVLRKWDSNANVPSSSAFHLQKIARSIFVNRFCFHFTFAFYYFMLARTVPATRIRVCVCVCASAPLCVANVNFTYRKMRWGIFLLKCWRQRLCYGRRRRPRPRHTPWKITLDTSDHFTRRKFAVRNANAAMKLNHCHFCVEMCA